MVRYFDVTINGRWWIVRCDSLCYQCGYKFNCYTDSDKMSWQEYVLPDFFKRWNIGTKESFIVTRDEG